MMNIEYEVQPQTFEEHLGELILAKIGDTIVGKTGYVQFNQKYANNNPNDALMKLIFDSPPDIIVERSMRKRGIGQGLMDKLVDQLRLKHYNTLFIAQPDGEKRFYSKVLERLFNKEKIISVHYSWAMELGPVYQIKITGST